MKTNIFKTGFIVVLAITTSSFTTISEKKVNVEESQITWKGYKVTGQHDGTINLSEGVLQFENNQLVGGSFTIDMTSITVTDLKAGNGKEKLEGHLKSDDFFGVENHATATFNITSVEGSNGKYAVTGALTIKGKTETKTFDMIVKEDTATANLKIDRSKFDVRYGSPTFFNDLKDKAIYDEFDLNINLKF